MKLGLLLEGVPLAGGQIDYEMEISSISFDSRTVLPNGLFMAYKGTKQDGTKYISHAISNGAACAIGDCQHAQCIKTPFPAVAFAKICANFYGNPAEKLKLIAITGTNGKTTTSNLLKQAIETVTGETAGLIGTNCNMIGAKVLDATHTTPDVITLHALLAQMVEAGCRYVVMEASSHALAQGRLAGLTFEVGIFTNLTQDHLDYHETMQAYRAAKGTLFFQCKKTVFNLDDEAGRLFYNQHKETAITYSENKDEADLTAKQISLHADHVRFLACTKQALVRVMLPIPGGFSIYNALAVLAGMMALSLDIEKAAVALAKVNGVKGRAEIVPVPADFTVMIDYAHTPNALENILLTARGFTKNRLICLFGCGGDRDKTKRSMMGEIAADLSDFVFLTSDNPRSEPPMQIIHDILPGLQNFDTPYCIEPDRITAVRCALSQANAGDVIVLAGKGHETYQQIQTQKIHLDEREIIADFFAGKQDKKPLSMLY